MLFDILGALALTTLGFRRSGMSTWIPGGTVFGIRDSGSIPLMPEVVYDDTANSIVLRFHSSST